MISNKVFWTLFFDALVLGTKNNVQQSTKRSICGNIQKNREERIRTFALELIILGWNSASDDPSGLPSTTIPPSLEVVNPWSLSVFRK